MPAIVLVGAQWGDEGKGKATDLLGDRVHYVVRYQGGNNAGHTVVIGDESYALHMLPSGVLSPHVVPVIGNGVVIDPEVLLHEIEGLAERGVGIVIDLRGGGERERVRVTRLGMQYVAIPWHCFNPRDQQFALFLRVLRDNPDKKVFVHCRLGVDRTGMMVASYRMGEQGWSASEAAKEMVAFGFSSLHRMMCPALSSYEAKFPWNFQTNPVFEGLRPADHSSQ